MISREELYELVWSTPMLRVAEQFSVSSSYLARICTLLNVPRPERGYWAKLAVGKAPSARPLPEARPGDPLHWSREGEAPPPRRKPQPPQRRQKAEVPVRVPKNRIHGLVRGAREHFANTRPVDEGAYLRPFKKLLLDVTASAACLDRALDFANDLFNAFESVSHRVVIAPPNEQLRRATIEEREKPVRNRDPHYHRSRWSPDRPTVVYIGSVAIGLAVVEMSEEMVLRYVGGRFIKDADYVRPSSRRSVDHSWTTTKELPCGRLRVIAYSPYPRVVWSLAWQETTAATLKSSIKSIVTSIEDAVPNLVSKLDEADRKAEIAHREWLEQQERWRREEDRRRVQQSVKDSHEQLGQVIRQWSSVMDIEHFLVGVEQRAAALQGDERDQILDRLRLAREFLGTRDPLDFFRAWQTPEERYSSAYPQEEAAKTT